MNCAPQRPITAALPCTQTRRTIQGCTGPPHAFTADPAQMPASHFAHREAHREWSPRQLVRCATTVGPKTAASNRVRSDAASVPRLPRLEVVHSAGCRRPRLQDSDLPLVIVLANGRTRERGTLNARSYLKLRSVSRALVRLGLLLLSIVVVILAAVGVACIQYQQRENDLRAHLVTGAHKEDVEAYLRSNGIPYSSPRFGERGELLVGGGGTQTQIWIGPAPAVWMLPFNPLVIVHLDGEARVERVDYHRLPPVTP
jgi:hypothetical protein